MKPTKWMFTMCIAAAVAAGCAKTINTTERADPIGRATPVNDARIITDSDVNSFARILGVHESVVSGDLVKVQVDVYNNRRYPERFNYKFEWYDLEGMMVDSPMSKWQPRTIQGKEQMSLIAIAPNPRAKDFRLKLQEHKGR